MLCFKSPRVSAHVRERTASNREDLLSRTRFRYHGACALGYGAMRTVHTVTHLFSFSPTSRGYACARFVLSSPRAYDRLFASRDAYPTTSLTFDLRSRLATARRVVHSVESVLEARAMLHKRGHRVIIPYLHVSVPAHPFPRNSKGAAHFEATLTHLVPALSYAAQRPHIEPTCARCAKCGVWAFLTGAP